MFEILKAFLKTFITGLMLISGNASADVLSSILEKGTMRVGVALFVPHTIQDKESGELSGFEIDVAENLASDLGAKTEFEVYNWEDIIPALEKGEIDIILGGMAITPARALRLNFTQPYSESGIGLATNTQLTKRITKLGDLNNSKYSVAVVADTVSLDFIKRHFDKITIKTYKTSEEAGNAVSGGQAHAFVGSVPQPKFLALNNPGKVDSPLKKPLLPYKIGMAVKKGEQQWLNFLNSWITARQADNWLTVNQKYWFDSLRWQTEVGK
ncbi:MAG TPA: transporter substrate-binding domain-containing protein [Gammaproteobacteria bacterium]|nr:transporter substrate-binding domain-containing protein [Gammaproteobacteria bacterium]HIL98337.1 transporter substrate-binding domain-containing protein [Pseudomonadales bacterium]